MKTQHILIAICALLVAACGASSYKVIGEYDPTKQSFDSVVIQDGTEERCPPLPAAFQESDLAGTWKTYFNATGTTTLIIKENGTYKQIHDYPPQNYHYEGSWYPWKLERRSDGPSYVHFEGMLSCGWFCGQSTEGKSYDFCGKRVITNRDNEAVLILADVLTDTLKLPPDLVAPRGLEMYEPKAEPDSLPVVYQLEH